MSKLSVIIAVCASSMLVSPVAFGYVGPGLGAGVLGVILGLLASVLIAIFAVVWYPVKAILKRLRKQGATPGSDGDST